MHEIEVGALQAFVDAQASGATPAVLLDVREPWEVALGTLRLDGARTLTWPMASVPERLAELDRTQPIVCFCHHGMRSAQVVAFLAREGCEAVYNLAGGTDAWSLEVDPSLPRY